MDSSGNWLRGYTRKIDLHDAHTEEIWAMFRGIELHWQERIINLKVESNSKVRIDVINQEA